MMMIMFVFLCAVIYPVWCLSGRTSGLLTFLMLTMESTSLSVSTALTVCLTFTSCLCVNGALFYAVIVLSLLYFNVGVSVSVCLCLSLSVFLSVSLSKLFSAASLKDLFEHVNPSAVVNFNKDINYYDRI